MVSFGPPRQPPTGNKNRKKPPPRPKAGEFAIWRPPGPHEPRNLRSIHQNQSDTPVSTDADPSEPVPTASAVPTASEPYNMQPRRAEPPLSGILSTLSDDISQTPTSSQYDIPDEGNVPGTPQGPRQGENEVPQTI